MTPHTGIAALDWVLSLLDGWGYLLVVLFTILENLFVIGSFTPGETIVMAAGFLTVKGHLDVRIVFACSIIGTVTGSNISYFFGRKGGRQALERYGGRLVDAERILAAEEYFERHGPKTVLIARFAAVFKNFVPVIAGASRMRIALFEAYTLAGALAYTTLMVVLGRVFGENFDKALAIARNITWAGLVLLLGMLAALWVGRRRYLRAKVEALAKEAEKEAAKDAEPQG
ncbi:DedA family protein [Coriobacteriia bacterium Es71-Z0120]|uniref:DedA family protein n=1 Tax=Parvivirga hydrogeniphila TaxID=2939460 RepID=UPI002260DB98|nr:DedA family protein [Parvivirga hydrogeniphila]MCL4079400.1 DedA family protein [Parvivirga hydrogeniphila]